MPRVVRLAAWRVGERCARVRTAEVRLAPVTYLPTRTGLTMRFEAVLQIRFANNEEMSWRSTRIKDLRQVRWKWRA